MQLFSLPLRLLGIALMLCVYPMLSAQGVEGKWLTYDPRNDKPLSVVNIYQVNNQFFGKITELYQYPPNDPNPICTACSGAKKDKPWIGLVILEKFVPNGNTYEGGTLLIPKYGVTLPCTLIFDPEQPDQLVVQGRIGFVKKSSTWERIKD